MLRQSTGKGSTRAKNRTAPTLGRPRRRKARARRRQAAASSEGRLAVAPDPNQSLEMGVTGEEIAEMLSENLQQQEQPAQSEVTEEEQIEMRAARKQMKKQKRLAERELRKQSQILPQSSDKGEDVRRPVQDSKKPRPSKKLSKTVKREAPTSSKKSSKIVTRQAATATWRLSRVTAGHFLDQDPVFIPRRGPEELSCHCHQARHRDSLPRDVAGGTLPSCADWTDDHLVHRDRRHGLPGLRRFKRSGVGNGRWMVAVNMSCLLLALSRL